MKFWGGDGNEIFPEANCPGDHGEGGRQIQGHGRIVPYAGTKDDAEYHQKCGRHGGVSVVVGGAFEHG